MINWWIPSLFRAPCNFVGGISRNARKPLKTVLCGEGVSKKGQKRGKLTRFSRAEPSRHPSPRSHPWRGGIPPSSRYCCHALAACLSSRCPRRCLPRAKCACVLACAASPCARSAARRLSGVRCSRSCNLGACRFAGTGGNTRSTPCAGALPCAAAP